MHSVWSKLWVASRVLLSYHVAASRVTSAGQDPLPPSSAFGKRTTGVSSLLETHITQGRCVVLKQQVGRTLKAKVEETSLPQNMEFCPSRTFVDDNPDLFAMPVSDALKQSERFRSIADQCALCGQKFASTYKVKTALESSA